MGEQGSYPGTNFQGVQYCLAFPSRLLAQYPVPGCIQTREGFCHHLPCKPGCLTICGCSAQHGPHANRMQVYTLSVYSCNLPATHWLPPALVTTCRVTPMHSHSRIFLKSTCSALSSPLLDSSDIIDPLPL